MQLFYCKDLQKSLEISEEESRHITKVLRLKDEDHLSFTDGEGGLFEVKIIDSKSKKCKIEIIRKQKRGSHPYYLHIAISPTKNMQRFEWFLEKATEIGIDEITPIICEKSERKKVKLDRCYRILVSAIKQSLKYHLPKLNDPIYFSDFIAKRFKGDKFIAYCKSNENSGLKNQTLDKRILILIGTEGDFTENEVSKALGYNFKDVSLGESRLRTETAGVFAVNTISIKK